MTEAPLFWLQQIENALEVLTEVPLWGSPPPFPWEKCSEQLSRLLQLPGLKISHQKTHFLKAEEFTSGLGANPFKTTIELSPLQGAALWLMPSEDILKLSQAALSPQDNPKGFSSSEFQEGFYRYLLLKVLQQIDTIKPFADLSPKLGPTQAMPQEGSLCIDILISLPSMTFSGRVVCPPSLHSAFQKHFSQKPVSWLELPEAKKTNLPLRLEIGHAVLSYKQWKTVEIGDLIVLDRCTYDPKSHKGTASLVLDGSPLFRARFKDNHLKIVEYAYYHEEEKFMEKDLPENQPADAASEKKKSDELPSEETVDDLSSLDEEELPSEDNEEHLWSAKEEQQDVETLLSAREVPLTLNVEVARLQMNLDKLLQLKPGNLIELPVKPEQGVDLVLNGKKVAKGELIKIGEVLGVKILQIGN